MTSCFRVATAEEEEQQSQSKKGLKKQQKEAEKAAKKAEKQAKLVSGFIVCRSTSIRLSVVPPAPPPPITAGDGVTCRVAGHRGFKQGGGRGVAIVSVFLSLWLCL